MKKFKFLLICFSIAICTYGQSSLTVGEGAYITIGQGTGGSNISAGNRNGSLRGTGTFNWLPLVLDPVTISATSIAQSSFSANWNVVNYATGYFLDVSTSSTFTSYVPGYQNLDVGNITSSTVSGLTAGTQYYYRVRAYDTDCITANSNVTTMTTAPPTPTATTATNINDVSFSANWNSVTGATGYRLDVAIDNSFTNFVAGFNNKDVGNVLTYSITGLTGNTNYYYRVRAYSSGTSGNSNTITALTAPAAPSAIAATSIGQTNFTAKWRTSAGTTHYYLDVSSLSNFSTYVTGYQNLDVNGDTTYSVSSNISAGTTYYYRVRASNGTSTGSNSNTITVVTVPPNPVAAAATNILSTSFSANWNAATSATGYYLDVSTDSNFGTGTFITDYNNRDVGNVLTFSVNTNLSGGVTYYYRVRAYNASGTSGNSGTITVLTIPVAPVAVAADSISQTSFRAKWNSVTGAAKYYLDVSTSSGFGSGTFVTGYQNLDVGNVITYQVNTNITAGTTYYYRVRANNATGTGGNSNTISLVTIPPNPTATAATNINEASFNANWNVSATATGYRLDVSTDIGFGTGTFVAGFQDKDVGNVTTYSVTGLTGNTTYYYRVRAYNNNGTSGNSGNITQLTAPSVPTATAASSIAQTSFSANWNASAGATGYRLDVSTDSGFGAGTFVTGYQDKDAGNVLTYSVNTNLTEGTTYYYRVRAYSGSGTSSSSGTINLKTIPKAPVESSATSVAATSFDANWNASTGASGYRLDVSTSSGFGAGTFVSGYQDKDIGNFTTTTVNTNLVEGTTYYYRVRAYNSGGTSGNSGVVTVTTVSTSPTANDATSIQSTSFTANWSSITGASGYTLDVSTDGTFATFFDGYNNFDVGNVTSFNVTGLSSGITYYFRVRAYNVSGSSGNSNTKSVITLSPAPNATPATSVTSTSFSANWNSAAGATGYYLDVATDNSFTTFVTGFNNKDVANVTTESVTGLTAGNTYYYRVRAYNASGTGANSSTITVKTIPPAPVEQSATSITNNSFDANWNSSSGASGYYLDVATDNLFTSFVAGYNGKNVGNVLTYSVTGLSESTSYYYRIRAYNNGGTSGNSGTVNPTTIASSVSVPSVKPASSVAATSFSANWNAAAGATGYYLDVATDNSFTAFVSGYNNKDVTNVTTESITGLTAGNTYYYRVRAHNASSTSGNSNTITVKTIPSAPVEQAASSIAATNFDANWSASTGATGYYLDVATDNGFTSFVAGFNNRDVGDVVTYTVTGLTGSTPYYYRIRAYNTGGTSGNSGTANPTTTAGGTVIATAATSITEVSFDANWNAYGGATGYKLDVSTASNFSSFVGVYNDLDVGAVVTRSVTGLSGGTNYYYRVKAYDGTGTLGTSGTINVITLPPAPVSTAASNIAGISFDANWNSSASATGYYLDVATDNSFTTYVTGFQNKYVNNVTTYSVTGLSDGTTYYYRVRGKNGSGTGANSSTITALTIPPTPTSTAATALTDNSFSANWNSSTGATGYRLDVSTASNFATFVGFYNNLDVGNVTTSSVTGLSGGTTYYYRIRAYNGSGSSGNSGTITALTLPSVPTSTAATSITQTSFTANWDATTGATKYYLDVATTSSFTGNYVSGYQNLDVNTATSYSVTGLASGTTYYYRVRAFNPSGTSSNSSNQSVLTIAPAPNVISATNIQSTSFSANWDAATSATGYKLDVSTVSNFSSFVGVYNDLDVGNVITYSVTGLTSGATYYYRVRAYNGSGTSSNSGTMTVLIAPAAPVATTATSLTDNSFSANWNSSSGADGYKLDVSTDPAFPSFVSGYNNKNVGTATTITVAGLNSGTNYYYRVRSYSGSRTSSNSNSITALTVPAVPVATAASSVNETSFSANWNASTGATKYFLDIATDNSFTSFVSGFNNKDVGNVTTYPVSSLTSNTNYYYRVRANNTSGTSGNSGTINALTAPTPPTATAATSVANTSLNANWNASTGATGYRLDVSTVSNFASFVGIYNNKDVSNVTTYSVSGLSGNITYYYRVRSYNGGGTSGNSNSITTTTAVDPSGVPTATAATSVAQTSFSANWNSVAGATGYRLDVSTDWNFAAGTFVTDFNDRDVNNVTTYSVTGLTGGTTYYYRVRSYNASGTSGNSGSITVLTLPAPPTATSATSIATTSFSANWNSSTGATKYYLDIATDNGFTSFVSGFNNKDVANVTTYSITGLSGGTNYYYRVRAYNATGTSSNSGTITTLTLPSAPVATAATSATATSFDANWNSATGSTGYKLYVSTDIGFGAGTFVTGFNGKDVGGVTSYNVTGLTAGTTYYYRVEAYNGSGTGSVSNTITSQTKSVAPTATAATLVTGTSFSANWNSVTGASKYYLDVSTDTAFAAGTFVTGYQNLDAGNVTTYSATGLAVNTNYYYRIRSSNSGGTSGNSNRISLLTAPAAPVATAATSSAESSFDANWNSSAGATGYRLDVSTDIGFSAGSFESGYEDKDVANVTTFSVSGITPNTTHYYRIRAYSANGTSSNSGTIKVLGVPNADQATAVQLTSFTANWNAVSGVTGYRLDVSTDIGFSAGTFLTGYQNKDVGNVTTWQVTGITSNMTYYYRVRSYDAGGPSGNSNIIIVKNLPTAPVATSASSIGSTSFTANWNASAGGAVGYFLDVATDTAFTNYVTGFQNKIVYNVTSYLVDNIQSGTVYYYRVRAYNSSGSSDNSNVINLISLTSAPVATAASSINQTSFVANWNGVTGAIKYYLDVATDNTFTTFVSGWNNVDAGNVTTYSVNTNIASGINYYYRVRGYNASGSGSNSNTISLITISGDPTAAAATSITPISFTANWNAVTGASKYYLDVATDNGFTSLVSGWNNVDVGNVTTYSVNTNISSGTTYYYRLRSNNTSGTSGNSGTITVLTLTAAPVATAASSITQTSFVANWNSVVGAAKYYLDVATDNTFTTFVTGWNNVDVGNVTAYSVNTNIISGTNYYYRVRGYNTTGNSSNSNTISLITIPGDPVATAATSITPTSFTANWNAVTGATKYYLDVATDNSFTTFVIGWNNKDVGNVTTYSVSTDISSGTTYYYRLRSNNVSGTSGNSGTITVLTLTSAPVATAASSITQTSFIANWNSVIGATKYYLDVATDNTFTTFVSGWNNVDVGNVTTYSVNTNIVSGTNYYYRVRGYNASGSGSNSNTISLITISGDPVATAATSITSTSFVANWNAVTGASKYYLDVATDNGFTSMVTGWNNVDVGNVTTYAVNTNISSGTTYYYRLRSNNTSGTSGNSGTITVLTLTAAPVATAASSITQTSFTANWNSVVGATKYYLDVATDNTFTTFVTGWNNVDVGNVTTYSVNTNIISGTNYYYRVRGYNATGNSSNSNTIELITIPGNPVATAATSITSTSFVANWNAATGTSKYYLDVATDNGFTSLVTGWNNKDVGNVTTYAVNTDISSGTTYYYRLRSNNVSGTSGNSGAITVLTLTAAPVATAASSIGQTSFVANWNGVVGATKYYLDVATDNTFTTFVTGWNNVDVGNVTTYAVNTNIISGTNYYYRVRGYNATGNSGNSNTISLMMIPGDPVATAATLVTSTSFTANWNAVTGVTKYYLDVATDNMFVSFVGGYNNKDVSTATTCSIPNLYKNTPYYYRVRSYNSSGTSNSSNIINVSTSPNMPPALTMTDSEKKSVQYKVKQSRCCISDSILVNDADNEFGEGAIVSISGNYISGEDVLLYKEVAGIVGTWDAGKGRIILTGHSLIANYQLALRSVLYMNANGIPNITRRTISVAYSDGEDTSNVIFRDVEFAASNIAPLITQIEQRRIEYTPTSGAVIVSDSLIVSDCDDSFLQSAEVKIAEGFISGEDVLEFSTTAFMPGVYNSSTGILTISGKGEPGIYETVLRTVKYVNAKGHEASQSTKRISFSVMDAQEKSNIADRIIFVNGKLTDVSDLWNEIPKEYVLYQNYPNPFNPMTVIRYGLPKESSVKLIIYNLLGQKVKELVNETKRAGYYRIEFNASDLPSGMYICSIQAENFRSVKKMLLIK